MASTVCRLSIYCDLAAKRARHHYLNLSPSVYFSPEKRLYNIYEPVRPDNWAVCSADLNPTPLVVLGCNADHGVACPATNPVKIGVVDRNGAMPPQRTSAVIPPASNALQGPTPKTKKPYQLGRQSSRRRRRHWLRRIIGGMPERKPQDRRWFPRTALILLPQTRLALWLLA